jgi:hypothetical protein
MTLHMSCPTTEDMGLQQPVTSLLGFMRGKEAVCVAEQSEQTREVLSVCHFEWLL